MFDPQEIEQLRGVVREEVRSAIREEVEPTIVASEKRVIETVVTMVGEVLDDNISPQIQELREDIARIKGGRWQLA